MNTHSTYEFETFIIIQLTDYRAKNRFPNAIMFYCVSNIIKYTFLNLKR